MNKKKCDWSDVCFAYHIGQTVYTVQCTVVNPQIELEPAIFDWVINGMGIDEHRQPMYHLEPPDNAPDYRWVGICCRFVPEFEILPSLEIARKKKVDIWEQKIERVIAKKREPLEKWKKIWECENDAE